MASDFDRDHQIDRLLKGATRHASAADPGPGCVDAETMAAWADGGLDPERVREVEAHVAACARCQMMAAAIFGSEAETRAGASAASPTVVPFKRNPWKYWLPIAGTLAATVLVYLGVNRNTTPTPELTMSQADTASAAPAPLEKQLQPVDRAQPASPVQGQSGEAEGRQALSRQQKAAPSVVKPGAAPIAPPAKAVAEPPPPAAAARIVAAAPPPAPPPVTGAAQQSAAAGRNAREETALRASVEARVIAEFSSDDPRSALPPGVSGAVAGGFAGAVGGGRGGGGGGGRGGAAGAAVIADATPALPMRWRIVEGDFVERSNDRVTWTAVPITPQPRGLAAGSATPSGACWLAGKAGLVLVSADGRTFGRATAPTDADLTAITATSALQAWVRTADGRTFTTTDGGKTWK